MNTFAKLKPAQQPYIILGIHRSGTSLLSKLLAISGVWMGNKQNINNEAILFHEINKKILTDAKSHPYFLYNISQKLNDETFYKNECIFAKKEISKKFQKKYLGLKGLFSVYQNFENFKWGFKDPRTIALLPIWKEIYPNAKLIFILRNPIDVCLSIYHFEKKRIESKNRKGKFQPLEMTLENSFKSWKLFTELILKEYNKNSSTSILIKYEELKKDETLLKLTQFLNVNININSLKKNINYNPNKYSFPPEFNSLKEIIKNDNLVKKLDY